jgi:hypothetical protein
VAAGVVGAATGKAKAKVRACLYFISDNRAAYRAIKSTSIFTSLPARQ